MQYQHLVRHHTLRNQDQICAISEVIVLSNDQQQHQKTILTNNSINSKINQQHTPFVDWCYCGREVLFEKVCLFGLFVCFLQVSLELKTISCQTENMNSMKIIIPLHLIS